jgi:hypothetical protein
MPRPPIAHVRPQRGCPEFRQLDWDDTLARHVATQAPAWFAEDLGHECDWTSVSLVDAAASSALDVVARRAGVIAGLPAAAIVAGAAAADLRFEPLVDDGAVVAAGAVVARLAGATRSVLAAERVILNLLGRLSGVATATRRLVDAVAGTGCRVYDTRKTVPGWRLLEPPPRPLRCDPRQGQPSRRHGCGGTIAGRRRAARARLRRPHVSPHAGGGDGG